MGYTTEFRGRFTADPALTVEQMEYLKLFSRTRRVKRDPEAIKILVDKGRDNPFALEEAMSKTGFMEEVDVLHDPYREQVGLPLGVEGEFFVGGLGMSGQAHDPSIVGYNSPPSRQPSLWCQWVPSENGKYIEWDGGEKFYRYVQWIEYLIDNMFTPWGVSLSGLVEWRGEEWGDTGTIYIDDGTVETGRRI